MPEAEKTYPVLRNAPIVESIAYFRLGPEMTDDAIAVFRERIRGDFPRDDVSETNSASGGSTLVFTSDDLKRFVRIGTGDLAYHKLAPYGDGNDFRNELRILWGQFRDVVAQVRVTQVALRAINRIEPDDSGGSHEDYFRTYPAISSGVPDELFSAFMRLGVLHPVHKDVSGVINWAAQPPTDPVSKVAFILDIEASRRIREPGEDAHMWESMELLRVFRNQLFFESITEKTVEVYR